MRPRVLPTTASPVVLANPRTARRTILQFDNPICILFAQLLLRIPYRRSRPRRTAQPDYGGDVSLRSMRCRALRRSALPADRGTVLHPISAEKEKPRGSQFGLRCPNADGLSLRVRQRLRIGSPPRTDHARLGPWGTSTCLTRREIGH